MILFDVSQSHPVLRTFVYIMNNMRKQKGEESGEEKGVVNGVYLEDIQKEEGMSAGKYSHHNKNVSTCKWPSLWPL